MSKSYDLATRAKVIRRALKLMPRDKWTTGTVARDEHNHADDDHKIVYSDAIAFCAVGAIARAAFDLGLITKRSDPYNVAESIVKDDYPNDRDSLYQLNDRDGFIAVTDFLRERADQLARLARRATA